MPDTQTDLTVEQVSNLVQNVKQLAVKEDHVKAHVEEDRAYIRVLKAIASGTCVDPRACAAHVITIKDLDFIRWYV